MYPFSPDSHAPTGWLQTGDEKHGPAATSTLDVLWVLYDEILDVSAAALDDPRAMVGAAVSAPISRWRAG